MQTSIAAKIEMILTLTTYQIDEDGNVIPPIVELTKEDIANILDLN